MADKKQEAELETLLSPVIKMWDRHSTKSFESASVEWQNQLSLSVNENSTYKNPLWIIITLLIFKPIQWAVNYHYKRLERKKVCEKRTIPRLLKTGLIQISENGLVSIQPPPINPQLAFALILIITVIFSFIVFWLVFFATPSIGLLIKSFVAGQIVGSLITIICDFSYSEQEIIKYYKTS